jgi:hypothetical protein
LRFSSAKIQFSSHEIRFSPIGFLLSSTAFHFLQQLSNIPQQLSAFFNSFPLYEKSENIYLRRQVYERSPFELCISRHLLPELGNCHLLPELCNRHLLPELCNCHSLPKLCNCYNACISPNSNMVLAGYSNALYLSKSNVQSRAGGHFFMSSNVELPPNNSAVSTILQIIKAVMSLAAKAKVGALFINCREAVPARNVLKFLGHPQPPTLMQMDNTTAL